MARTHPKNRKKRFVKFPFAGQKVFLGYGTGYALDDIYLTSDEIYATLVESIFAIGIPHGLDYFEIERARVYHDIPF